MKKFVSGFGVLVMGMSIFLSAPVQASIMPVEGPNTTGSSTENAVSVSGSGTVSVAPDTAILNVGVETKGKTSKEAQEANKELSQKVMNTILGLGVAKEDVKTQYYNLHQDYDYQREGGRELIGYRANHSLNIKIRDLDSVSNVLDKVTESGVTNVSNVQYVVENQAEALDKARIKAALNAVEKAKKLGGVFGFQVGALLSVTETENHFMPMARGLGGGGAAESIIKPGDVEVRLSLKAVFALKPGKGVDEVYASLLAEDQRMTAEDNQKKAAAAEEEAEKAAENAKEETEEETADEKSEEVSSEETDKSAAPKSETEETEEQTQEEAASSESDVTETPEALEETTPETEATPDTGTPETTSAEETVPAAEESSTDDVTEELNESVSEATDPDASEKMQVPDPEPLPTRPTTLSTKEMFERIKAANVGASRQ